MKFALAGNPNCGKTTLFNALTGSTAHVGNWPGVTVDKKEGVYKKLKKNISIIDLPGIYSLSPYTPEEIIARNYILEGDADCVINIIDATNLERNLYLTTQIAEMDIPMVVALNMMDVIENNGDRIDVEKLSEALGVPVVAISAQKGTGIDDLMKEAYIASDSKREGKTVLEASAVAHLIKDVTSAFKAIDVKHPLFHAVKLIENDELEVNDHKDLVKIVDEFKNSFNDDVFGSDLEAVVADARYQYISKNYSITKTKKDNSRIKASKSDKIDKILTNRWVGIPIFLVILFLVFHLTFSENLFWIGSFVKLPTFAEGTFFEGLLYGEGGINSIGVILQSIVTTCTDGLSELVAGWLASAGASGWAQGLIVDGILAGVFAVLSFVPQILLLFLFFSILEDSGYMARVAFILDRIFRRFGLSGRAFMPMIMGFGCSVPAMINTRTLSEENERTATVRVIPFFSCGAKLPILTAIAGAICVVFNFPNADLITYAMYLVGMATAIITIILMRNTTMRGKTAPFIMELPEYHMPQFKALMIHLWDKLKHYVKKAFTIILVSTIAIWFLQSFTFDWNYIEMESPTDIADEAFSTLAENDVFKLELKALDESYIEDDEVAVELADLVATYTELEENSVEEIAYKAVLLQVFTEAATEYNALTSDPNYKDTSDSILAGLGKLVTPLFTPLGFGSQLNENGWVYPVSAVTGLIAKENVIATFSVLAQSTATDTLSGTDYLDLYITLADEEGISSSNQLIKSTGIGWPALIAFIVFNMTTIPCFAAVATAKGELSKKKFLPTILFWLATSYVAGTITYLSLQWPWTIIITVLLAIGVGVGIYFYNKAKDNRKLANA